MCARLDLLRRQIEVRRRADSVFDKERRTRVGTPAAELICEVTYPPEHLNGPYESLGVTFQLRAVHTAGEVAYPWPARPADDLCEPLWHDAATVPPPCVDRGRGRGGVGPIAAQPGAASTRPSMS
nr:hypothetical protein GCM10020063_022250 [Dactylosporangium thailandense]